MPSPLLPPNEIAAKLREASDPTSNNEFPQDYLSDCETHGPQLGVLIHTPRRSLLRAEAQASTMKE